MTSSNLSAPLIPPATDQPPALNPVDPNNREVEVWVRDVNGLRYGVRMPISSTFNDVMQKVRGRHGHFQGIVVGFEGGRNEFTTISQMLPANLSPNEEQQHLRDHPIQPKFKVRHV
jgi:hypothetical protein